MTSACFSRGHTGFSRNATLVATVNPPALAGGVFNQVHATVSQRPGQPSRSGPPVPWRDCTVEGRASLPCRPIRVGVYIRVPARQRKALSGRLRATDSERARGGGSGTRARASLSGFRGMTGSRPAQRTVWTNPALWSATNQGNFFFSGQGPVGGAGILHGRRAVRAHFRTAARTRWAGSESGRKKVVERGEAGL